MKHAITLTVSIICFHLLSLGQSCPLGLSGTYKIGPTGAYATLQSALSDLHTKGVTSPVLLELQSTYSPASEVYPIELNAVPCSGQGKGITIRPEAGAGPITFSTDNTTTALDINNGSYYTIDGRAGGTDSARGLVFDATSIYATAIRIVNGANYNKIKYLTAKGIGVGGVVSFGNSDSATGNNYNRLDSCDVTAGSITPAVGIQASGFHVLGNRGNVINGCNVYNFGNTKDNSYSSGISILSGYDSFYVTNNNVYQTPDHFLPYNSLWLPYHLNGININSPYNGGHTITGNYIGGTAPGAAGSPLTMYQCGVFNGIYVANIAGAGAYTRVDSNRIDNLSFQTIGGNYQLINLNGFNGECAGNILGSSQYAYSITAAGNGSGSPQQDLTLAGILLQAETGRTRITGNKISGIQTAPDLYSWVAGIDIAPYTTQYPVTIDNNTIGDSIHSSISISMQGPGNCYGVVMNGPMTNFDTVNIINNFIECLYGGIMWVRTTAISNVEGVSIQSNLNGYLNISNNDIYNLTSMTAGEKAGGIMAGIDASLQYNPGYTHSPSMLVVSHNNISQINSGNNLAYGFSYLGGQADYGIRVNGEAGGQPSDTVLISNNAIQGISANVDTNATAQQFIIGLSMATQGMAPCRVENNMIDISLYNGVVQDSARYTIYGIQDASGTNNYIHNSLYVRNEGIQSAAVFYSTTASTQPRNIQNNIIMSNRHTTGHIQSNQAVYLAGSSTGLTMDYNLYCVKNSAFGSVFSSSTGLYTTDTLTTWQSGTGHDGHSLQADPLYNSPDSIDVYGTYRPRPDLHVRYLSPVDTKGNAAVTTVLDFDGQVRSGLTPVDIGADAGDFTIAPPPPPPPPPVDSTGTDTTTSGVDTVVAVAAPNPVVNAARLSVRATQAGTVQIVIYNMNGKQEILQQANVDAGTNSISIPMDTLPDGQYAIKVQVDGKTKTIQVMKRSS